MNGMYCQQSLALIIKDLQCGLVVEANLYIRFCNFINNSNYYMAFYI